VRPAWRMPALRKPGRRVPGGWPVPDPRWDSQVRLGAPRAGRMAPAEPRAPATPAMNPRCSGRTLWRVAGCGRAAAPPAARFRPGTAAVASLPVDLGCPAPRTGPLQSSPRRAPQAGHLSAASGWRGPSPSRPAAGSTAGREPGRPEQPRLQTARQVGAPACPPTGRPYPPACWVRVPPPPRLPLRPGRRSTRIPPPCRLPEPAQVWAPDLDAPGASSEVAARRALRLGHSRPPDLRLAPRRVRPNSLASHRFGEPRQALPESAQLFEWEAVARREHPQPPEPPPPQWTRPGRPPAWSVRDASGAPETPHPLTPPAPPETITRTMSPQPPAG
jgi:hypothetical protein